MARTELPLPLTATCKVVRAPWTVCVTLSPLSSSPMRTLSASSVKATPATRAEASMLSDPLALPPAKTAISGVTTSLPRLSDRARLTSWAFNPSLTRRSIIHVTSASITVSSGNGSASSGKMRLASYLAFGGSFFPPVNSPKSTRAEVRCASIFGRPPRSCSEASPTRSLCPMPTFKSPRCHPPSKSVK